MAAEGGEERGAALPTKGHSLGWYLCPSPPPGSMAGLQWLTHSRAGSLCGRHKGLSSAVASHPASAALVFFFFQKSHFLNTAYAVEAVRLHTGLQRGCESRLFLSNVARLYLLLLEKYLRRTQV